MIPTGSVIGGGHSTITPSSQAKKQKSQATSQVPATPILSSANPTLATATPTDKSKDQCRSRSQGRAYLALARTRTQVMLERVRGGGGQGEAGIHPLVACGPVGNHSPTEGKTDSTIAGSCWQGNITHAHSANKMVYLDPISVTKSKTAVKSTELLNLICIYIYIYTHIYIYIYIYM